MRKSVTLFISDLHLQAAEPHITRIFLQFLQEQAIHADRLFILGDLFEAWIGDDDLNAFNLQIIEALKQATQTGLPIYFMRGNRDFLIGQKFAALTGVRLLKDPTVIDLYGQPTLLMHGDSLCIHDRKHQFWRRMTLNPLYRRLALCMPLSWRKSIGIKLRQQSHQHQNKLSAYIMDICSKSASLQMQAHQTTQLIHGHTHRPSFHTLDIKDQMGKRIVLGAWHHKGSVLKCDPNGCELQDC